ncbi:CGNR zinc finger domain-containing protein [Actinoplanes sp. NPDC049599]|uniref:CGNR zinc finger domain-containing protein n=1 Tax=Actinoplanes sp. NPDC049599 TaxID=3363903 RepID=UPI0037A50CBB
MGGRRQLTSTGAGVTRCGPGRCSTGTRPGSRCGRPPPPARPRSSPSTAGCRSVFYDRSKNGSKTWCSMEVCGNRNKTRSYRRRQAGATD